MSDMSLRTSDDPNRQESVICGFIPPYIFEEITRSDEAKKRAPKAITACQHALNHSHIFHQRRQASFEQAQVSFLSIATGFVPPYILETTAHSKKAVPQAQLAAQQPLEAEAPGPATPQRKIYDCKETANLPGTLVRAEGQKRVKDRQVNNCYDAFGITYNFYLQVFGRNSLDGRGLPLIGNIHYEPKDSPDGFDNAFWHSGIKQMIFGDGDGVVFDYLTDSLDVVAHELTHGFVQFSSPLRYYWQSGALNESCADVFACMVEQWHIGQTAADADWNLGQTIFPVAFRGSCLRTLRAGKAYVDDPIFKTDPQPKHMKDLFTGDADQKGVHYNSGIPNHAFYLAATSIGGYSWEKAGKVWYKTMTSGRIPFECDFETFAKVTVQVAGEILPDDQSAQTKIRDAWRQVGVL